MVGKLRDCWFRFRHRKSRAEVIAFGMGIRVGRELNHMTDAQVDKMINDMKDGYER